MDGLERGSHVDVGRIIQHAVVFDPKRWPREVMMAVDVPQAVAGLFALLDARDVPFVVVGGIAMLQYVDGRNTQDIDLLLAGPDLARLPEIELESVDPDFARGVFRGALRVDVLLTRNPLFREVQQAHSTVRPFAGRDIPCATVGGLLLLKLFALPSLYRQGHFARVGLYENDIATLIEAYRPPLDPLLAILGRFLSETDLAAVREVLGDIEGRLERFGRQSGAVEVPPDGD